MWDREVQIAMKPRTTPTTILVEGLGLVYLVLTLARKLACFCIESEIRGTPMEDRGLVGEALAAHLQPAFAAPRAVADRVASANRTTTTDWPDSLCSVVHSSTQGGQLQAQVRCHTPHVGGMGTSGGGGADAAVADGCQVTRGPKASPLVFPQERGKSSASSQDVISMMHRYPSGTGYSSA